MGVEMEEQGARVVGEVGASQRRRQNRVLAPGLREQTNHMMSEDTTTRRENR